MKSEAANREAPRSDVLPIAGKLFLICAVAAVVLGLVNMFTAPVIERHRVEELRRALAGLTPNGAQAGDPVPVSDTGTVRVFYPVTRDGSTVGYILELHGNGYGGDMKILARYGTGGEVEQVLMMEDLETPGLGKKAENPAYMQKFVGTGGDRKPVPVRKDMLGPQDADAVTGATITFSGVGRALQAGSEYVRSRS